MAGFCVAVLMFVGLLAASQAASCDGGEAGLAPSAEALADIPGNYLAAYVAAGAEYRLDWAILAAVGRIETDHGRSRLPGVTSGVNTYGCCGGPMQFFFKPFEGRLAAKETNSSTWGAMSVDGNDDGVKDVWDPSDAIPSAARYLKASGAPGDYRKAIFAYNRANWYVDQILAQADTYRSADNGRDGVSGALSLPADTSPAQTTAASSGCDDLAGLTGTGDGSFSIAPGANAPGRPLTESFTAFISRMATFYDGTLVLTTGTNHDRLTTSGNVSDHFSGNGGDFGMVLNGGTDDGPVGDRIAAAAFLAAGVPRDEAIQRGRAGGAQTVVTSKLSVQIIWKSDVGGNHHNHVHVGIQGL